MDEPGKVCVTCHEWRPLTAYNKRSQAKDGLQSRCRSCNRIWYERNKETHVRNVRLRNDRVRLEWQSRLREYLLRNPCVDCGECDLRVLEFDHRDPASKRGGVGRLLSNSLSWSRIQAEIDKCDVRCSNCHRIRTMTDCDSWRVVAEAQRLADLRDVRQALLREVWEGA